MRSKKKDFQTKLAIGEAIVTRRTSWWPRHASSLIEYLQSRASSDGKVSRNIRTEMEKIAQEWEFLLPASIEDGTVAVDLMCSHTDYERKMIDGAIRGSGRDVLRAEGDKIARNLTEQAAFYCGAIPDFPAHRFSILVTEHVMVLLDCVGAYLDGYVRKFSESNARFKANTAALAAFTAEWF